MAAEIREAQRRPLRLVTHSSPAPEVGRVSLVPLSSPSPSPAPVCIVADDDPSVRRVVTGFLERAGWAVVAVPDGDTLLAQIESAPGACACVVMDARMPGPALADRLARLHALRADLPVVVITGDRLLLGHDPDATVVPLEKPFLRQDLLAAIASAGARAAA